MKIPSLLVLGCVLGLLAVAGQAGAAEPASTAAPEQSHFQLPATDEGMPGAGPVRRFDWFKKLWLERRTDWAAHIKEEQGSLVFLGDSITQGFDARNLFPGVKLVNRGISGDTTRGVLYRLQEDVLALNPSGVVLLIGTNDLEDQAEPEVAAENLRLIIAQLKQHSATMPVVLCRVFPSSASKKRPMEKIVKLNALYDAIAREEPQITILDTWALFAGPHGDARESEFPDLLHPNAVGNAKWAAALRPILETLGLMPAWPDDFTPETGFESLFNGRDLSGWGYADGPKLDGQTATGDGRYVARNDRLIVTVSRQQRDYKKLWTTRTFPKDFVLRLEFRASPNADSGIYVRDPQLQCRDYTIAGPFAGLPHYRPLDWNEIIVTVKGGLAHCTCNGDVLVDAMPVPATGPIGLESDHGQMEYRRIRVQELK
jgi:lysophospholipase L1-like esterase